MANKMFFNDLVKGNYGRKIAYADVEEVTENNIVSIVGKTLGIFNYNRRIVEYLWDYYKGDQPVLYRTKRMRNDINNKICENHAYEIVQFKVGQTYGEPLQCVGVVKDKINEYIDRFNTFLRQSHKHARNIKCGEWQSAVGTGFMAVSFVHEKKAAIPFRITVPTPLNTYIIYSSITEEPLVSVQELKDENGEYYKSCHTKTHQCIIKNSKVEGWKLHAFGDVPIVEYPNNFERISDIELVMSMLDALNEVQSNRADGISQFIQSFVKFVNCTIDEETFEKMKMNGAFVVKSNNAENKSDVEIMSQELNQTETQVAKQDLMDNILQILAIPKLEGNTGGDTQGAVQLRNGWDMAKTRGKLKDPIVQESEQRLNNVILNVIRVQSNGENPCPIDTSQFEVVINHSPMDNMLVKAQFLDYLLKDGVHPKLAFERSTLFSDSEKAYNLSKPYLDVLYQTIDETNRQNAQNKNEIIDNQTE